MKIFLSVTFIMHVYELLTIVNNIIIEVSYLHSLWIVG